MPLRLAVYFNSLIAEIHKKSMSYKYLEHSTDAFIEVKAKNLEEAFSVAGKSVVENSGSAAGAATGNRVGTQELGPIYETAPDSGVFELDMTISYTDGPASSKCPSATKLHSIPSRDKIKFEPVLA